MLAVHYTHTRGRKCYHQVRLGTYASDVYMPPSAIVASKAMANDPRAEPKYCERVPYVVVAGPVGARLMDLVRASNREKGMGVDRRTLPRCRSDLLVVYVYYSTAYYSTL